MFGFSFGEILFLGLLALIVVGPQQLPEVARNLARFINDLKRSTQGLTDELKMSAKVDFDIKRDITDAAKAAVTNNTEKVAKPTSEAPTIENHENHEEAEVSNPELKPKI
jgi:sec-independent protein translocase protein TatB